MKILILQFPFSHFLPPFFFIIIYKYERKRAGKEKKTECVVHLRTVS